MPTANDKKEVRLNIEVATTVPRPLKNAYRMYLIIESHKEPNGTLSLDAVRQFTGYGKSHISKLINKGNGVFWIYKWDYKQARKVLRVFKRATVEQAIRETYKSKESDVLVNRRKQTSVVVDLEHLKTTRSFSQMLIGVVAELPNRGKHLLKKGLQEIRTKKGVIKREIVKVCRHGTKDILHYKTNTSISRLTGFGRTKVSTVLSSHKNKTRAITRLNFSFKTKHEAVSFMNSYSNNELGEYMLERGKRCWFKTRLFNGKWFIYEMLGTEYKDFYTKDRTFTFPVGVRAVGKYQAYTTNTKRKLSSCYKGIIARLQLEETHSVGYSFL